MRTSQSDYLRAKDRSENLVVDGRQALVLRIELPDVDIIYANEGNCQWPCLW